MRGRISLMACVMVLAFARTALADSTVPLAARGITVQQGQGKSGLDFSLDLSKGAVAKEVWLGTQYMHDLHNGLSFRYGILEELQLGAALSAMYWNNATGAEFGGGDLYRRRNLRDVGLPALPGRGTRGLDSGVDMAIPLGLKVGGTVAPALDLAMTFNFADLHNQKADSRPITLAAAYLF